MAGHFRVLIGHVEGILCFELLPDEDCFRGRFFSMYSSLACSRRRFAAASDMRARSSRLSISAMRSPFLTWSPTLTGTASSTPVARAPILTCAPTCALTMPVASRMRETVPRSMVAVLMTLILPADFPPTKYQMPPPVMSAAMSMNMSFFMGACFVPCVPVPVEAHPRIWVSASVFGA